jgi:hypothetical protein
MHVHLLEADFGKLRIWRQKKVLYGYALIHPPPQTFKSLPGNLILTKLERLPQKKNGRCPKKNGRRPQMEDDLKWKTTSIFFKSKTILIF